jgi:hypothetical protein
MNKSFLELVQSMTTLGYEVKMICREKPEPQSPTALAMHNKSIGDIVLHLSPVGRPKQEVME